MRRRGAQTGFTLVEVVVAAGVLSVAALGLCTALATSLRAASVERERTVALAAARAELDEVLALLVHDEHAVEAKNGVPFSVAGLLPVPPAAAAGKLTVTDADDRVLYVAVLVRWRGSMGDDQVELTAFTKPVKR